MITCTLRSAVRFVTKTKAGDIENFSRLSYPSLTNVRNVHITSNILKDIRIDNKKCRPVDADKNKLLEGEASFKVNLESKNVQFPDVNTPYKLFNGIQFKDLPIINIKATSNNTILSTTSAVGKGILLHSAGIEGFKNARKGTNIGAQQTAIVHGTNTINRGIKTVRIRVQGIGAGRMAAIKGLQLAGLNIVSITDDTRVTWNPLRPRKPRRI